MPDSRSASMSDNNQYRRLIQGITDYAIYMLDLSGAITSWNPGATRIKGYTEEEILGQNFSVFFTPEDRSAGLPGYMISAAIAAGRFEDEGWRVRKDGSRFWANVVVDLIEDEHGKAVGLAKITRDLTENRANQSAILQGERKLRFLVDSIKDYAIFSLNLDGMVTSWNLGAERCKGYRAQEIIGQHFSVFFSESDRRDGIPAQALASALSMGRYEQTGWRFRKDGTRFWANVVIQPFAEAGGQVSGFVKVTRDISDRLQIDKLKEELLQAQAREIALLTDNSSDLVIRKCGDVISYVSPACEHILGCTQQELIDCGLHALIHPDDLCVTDTANARCGEWWVGRLRRADGSFRWVEASSDPRHFDGRPAEEGVVVMRDIHQRVVDRETLHESEARYRLLAEYASDMIVRFSLDFECLYVSPACRDILDYAPEEFIELWPHELVHPDDAVAIAEAAGVIRSGTDRITITQRLRNRDSRWIWIEARLVLVRDANGQPVEIVGILRDITAGHDHASRLAQVADQLRVANSLLHRAEEMTHIGHWRIEIDSREVHWSDEICRIYGWEIGRPATLGAMIENCHPDDRALMAQAVETSLATGNCQALEVRIVRPNGALRQVSARSEPERDSNGVLVAVVGTLQDCTERHRLEADLLQAKKLEAVGRVSAGIAHDFNNVLQGIMGGLELIADPETPVLERQEYAAVAMSSAKRGATITSGLLSYARQQALQPKRVRMAPLLYEMRGMLAPILPTNIQLKIMCEPDRLTVDLDPEHLQTALHNLAVNAIQAMPNGGTLTLKAGVGENNAIITVADTGTGMDAATAAQAFEPFFTTKGVYGTGLGLSMVQGFVNQSGGEVGIASKPGLGTEVEIRFPSCVAAENVMQPRTRPLESACKRVLLVDDVADVLMISGAFLRSAGFDVVEVINGDAAMAQFMSGGKFDALVTDYVMPGLSGLDLILQAREFLPDLPALLTTGYSELTKLTRLPAAVEILAKPYQRATLVAAVRRAIGREPAASVAARTIQ